MLSVSHLSGDTGLPTFFLELQRDISLTIRRRLQLCRKRSLAFYTYRKLIPLKTVACRAHLKKRSLVGRTGFEPVKAEPTDLQSVPFNHSGTSPYTMSLLFQKFQKHYALFFYQLHNNCLNSISLYKKISTFFYKKNHFLKKNKIKLIQFVFLSLSLHDYQVNMTNIFS